MPRVPPPATIAGKSVATIGYGMMNLTVYGTVSHDDQINSLKAAIDNGANFWNGGDFYGPPTANSLHLLKDYFTKYPEDASKVVLSIKGAYDATTHTPKCKPESIRASVDEALRLLDGTHTIDLFECARIDPEVPCEDMVKTLVELIKEGKIGSYGLSEVNAQTIRRCHAVYPPAAVEVEISLFSRHALEKGGIIDTCHELGIPVIGYSVLDRGWLTGQLKKISDIPPGDNRHYYPRFQPGNFEKNVKLAEIIEGLAKRKGVTAAQLAIAWVTQLGVLAIPGATKPSRVAENCKVIKLTDADLSELQKALKTFEPAGERYPEIFLSSLNK
ncbi:NADP-dependent oxidoreductase domain-containing protein [Xylaria sp. CBS 124048]|nr:NADP-dependent oxidoreductase domain-containing protein [Xylaria sp. CBS 124048]